MGLHLRMVIKLEFFQEITFGGESKSLIRVFVIYLFYLKTYRTKSETPYLPSNEFFSCFGKVINT